MTLWYTDVELVLLVKPLDPLVLPVEHGVERTHHQTRAELEDLLVRQHRVHEGDVLKQTRTDVMWRINQPAKRAQDI